MHSDVYNMWSSSIPLHCANRIKIVRVNFSEKICTNTNYESELNKVHHFIIDDFQHLLILVILMVPLVAIHSLISIYRNYIS